METLKIRVPNKQKAQKMLKKSEMRTDVASVHIVPSRPLPSHKKAKLEINKVMLASEASLAKDWLSPEDGHWDNVYSNLCIRKAV